MAITLAKLHSFQPFVNGCKEAEPQLRDMLMQYYAWGGFSKVKAYELADEYIRKLKDFLNEKGPDPLGEALNSGDGSYRP